MHIGWPQGILLVLLLLGVGVNLAQHGQPQKPTNGIASLIAATFTLSLLWWGGFFGG